MCPSIKHDYHIRGDFMRPILSCLTLMCLLSLSACGSDSDPEDLHFGSEDSLHPDRESILSKNIEEHPEAMTLEEAEAIKIEVPPSVESNDELLRTTGTSTSDQSLLSQFALYPGQTISSRVLGKGLLLHRDTCLQKCVDNPRCGGVSYTSVGGFCLYHGPTQTNIDVMAPLQINTRNGTITYDTYILSARNVIYQGGGTLWVGITSNNNGVPESETYRVKVLYTDGTASVWQSGSGSPVFIYDIPLREMEGALLSAPSGSTVTFDAANIYVQGCDEGCLNFPLVAWHFGTQYRISTKCDSDVTDKCAPTIGMATSIPNQDPPFNTFVAYDASGEELSLDQLQTFTNRFTW